MELLPFDGGQHNLWKFPEYGRGDFYYKFGIQARMHASDPTTKQNSLRGRIIRLSLERALHSGGQSYGRTGRVLLKRVYNKYKEVSDQFLSSMRNSRFLMYDYSLSGFQLRTHRSISSSRLPNSQATPRWPSGTALPSSSFTTPRKQPLPLLSPILAPFKVILNRFLFLLPELTFFIFIFRSATSAKPSSNHYWDLSGPFKSDRADALGESALVLQKQSPVTEEYFLSETFLQRCGIGLFSSMGIFKRADGSAEGSRDTGWDSERALTLDSCWARAQRLRLRERAFWISSKKRRPS